MAKLVTKHQNISRFKNQIPPLASWLNNNSFSGPTPDLTNCTKIFDLQLDDNQLVGVVPTSLSSLRHLRNISLQNNNLYGPYPNFSSTVKVETGNMSNLCSDKPGVPCNKQVVALLDAMEALGNPMKLVRAVMILTNDSSSVAIRMEMWPLLTLLGDSLKVTSLLDLHLNDDAFIGGIPESFTLLPRLKVLDVSNNYLNGLMPKFQSSVRVNVTGNILVVNESIFEDASASTVTDFQTPASSGSNSTRTTNSRLTLTAVKRFMLFSPLVTLVLFIIYIILKCIYWKRRDVNQREEDPEEQLSDENLPRSQVVASGDLLRRFLVMKN